jgi:uncharacterized protein (TIGR02118 family)
MRQPAMSKVVCVVRVSGALDAPDLNLPDEPGLAAYAIHLPCTDEPAERPPDVAAVVMAWLDRRPDPPALQRWFPDALLDAYLVEERVLIDYERDWPDGVESPGVRRISFVQAAPGVSRSEMAEHWADVHWPLARVHHPALWRYVQNVVVEPITPDTPAVDGIAELHFRSIGDLRDRFYDSDEGRRIVADDVRAFLDRSAGWRVLARETWLCS